MKNKYLKLKSWIDSIDRKKLELVSEYDNNVKNIFYDTKSISSNKKKDYILGDKIVNLSDISKYMIDKYNTHLSNYYTEDPNARHYCDSTTEFDDSGYYSKLYIEKLVNYFENLNDSSLLDIACGIYKLDIGGGRYYLNGGFSELTFNYLAYTKKMTMKEFDDMIYNGNNSSDDIYEFYSILNKEYIIPSDEEFLKLYNSSKQKKYSKVISEFNNDIQRIVNKYKSNDILSEYIDQLKVIKLDEKVEIRNFKLKEII